MEGQFRLLVPGGDLAGHPHAAAALSLDQRVLPVAVLAAPQGLG